MHDERCVADESPKRILVVDDEPPMCLYISMLLARDGYDVEMANNAAQALQKLESEKFDAVLTDFIMDPTNGEDLARIIKQRRPRQPVVMVTGFPPRRRSTIVDAYIIKPFSTELLRDTLHDIFHRAEPPACR
jgi:two-component system, NtrC family, response regulator PilR